MFGFIWRMPWFIYLIAAVAVVAFGFFLQNDTRQLNAIKALALQGPAPQAINTDKVTSSSFTDAGEINVKAQVLLDQIFTVSVSGRKTIDKEKTLLFAFSPDAADNSQDVQVAFMLDTKVNVSDFIKKFATQEKGALSPILTVNGESYYPGSKLEKVVRDAANKANVKLASNIQYVEPFMAGREEALKPSSESGPLIFMAIIALILSAYGALRYFLTRNKKA